MNSRERVRCSVSHKQPDKLPVDLGSTADSGIHVSNVYRLRQHFGLDDPGTPVKIISSYAMLGEIKDDLKEAIGIDTCKMIEKTNMFGIKRENFKEWKLWDGTPVLVPEKFNTEYNEDGSLYQYPQGDKSCRPSGKYPKNGWFIDVIVRQEDIKEDELDPGDNLEEFKIFSEENLKYIKDEINKLYNNTNYSIVFQEVLSGIGDIAFVPGPSLKNPKGIRDEAEWYISIYKRRDYVKKVFEGQIEIAMENYKRLFEAVGNKIDIVLVTGTDFGMQENTFIPVEVFRDSWKPLYKKVNDWIHNNTNWKCFIHTDGSVYDLIPDFIEAGFDILNPVQFNAAKMEPKRLKKEFGKYLAFWGGGVDTQKTLPFGKSQEVKDEVRRLIDIFFKDGGYVFSTVHDVQGNVPLENLLAMIEVIQEYRK